MVNFSRATYKILFTAILHLIAVSEVSAQIVRGTVVTEESRTPVAGAVVLLVSTSDSSIVGRSRTSPDGLYQISVATDGRFLLRVLRIGNRPFDSDPLELSGRVRRTIDLVLPALPIQLARFDVRAQARCQRNPGSGTLAGQLLREARTAFLSSVSSSVDGDRQASYRFFRFSRDTRGTLVDDTTSIIRSRRTVQPFTSLSPDSLERIGYVSADGDSVVYRAPDAEVLLSDRFASSHCFRVIEGRSERQGQLGIGFEPSETSSDRVGIRGTIWIDSARHELRDVEFTYHPLSREEQQVRVGGVVRFARLNDGAWLVRSWELRMPSVQIRRYAPVLAGRPTPARTVREVTGIQVFGGAVMRIDGVGVAFADSAELGRASVSASSPFGSPSAQIAITRHPVCGVLAGRGVDLSARSVGVVEGMLHDQSGSIVADAVIRAEWRAAFRVGTDARVTFQNRGRETRSQDDGRFVVCELPYEVPITLRVIDSSGQLAQRTVRLSTAQPIDSVNLVVQRRMATTPSVRAAEDSALLRVLVLGEDGRPLPNAEVLLASRALSRDTLSHRTDEAGYATFGRLPAGEVGVAVRRVGESMRLLRLDVQHGRNEVVVRMTRTAQSLDPIRTIGDRVVNARYADLERRIRSGAASAVVTRGDIERLGPVSLGQMLRRLQGLRLEDSSGVQVVTSARGDRLDRSGKMVPCVLHIMVDGVLSSASQLSAMVPADVHAIEVFLGAARIPLELGSRSSGWCGLVAVWTRVE